MKRQKEAVSRFKGALNCSQSVFSTFAPSLGLDYQTALKVATPFGGGMAHMGEMCGSLSGAMMVIGLKVGMSDDEELDAKEKTYALSQELVFRFLKRNGSVRCRELIGYDLSDPEEYETAKRNEVFETVCTKFVRDAVEILEELLRRE